MWSHSIANFESCLSRIFNTLFKTCWCQFCFNLELLICLCMSYINILKVSHRAQYWVLFPILFSITTNCNKFALFYLDYVQLHSLPFQFSQMLHIQTLFLCINCEKSMFLLHLAVTSDIWTYCDLTKTSPFHLESILSELQHITNAAAYSLKLKKNNWRNVIKCKCKH